MAERQDREVAAPSRRAVFRAVGLGVGAAGAAAAGVRPESAEAAATRSDGSLGYRETDHVKKVYETARF
jgi:hypothetical protein